MKLPEEVGKRLMELHLPVEAIEHEKMGPFYKEGWLLIVRDMHPNRIEVDVIGPKCPLWEEIQELLAYYAERE